MYPIASNYITLTGLSLTSIPTLRALTTTRASASPNLHLAITQFQGGVMTLNIITVPKPSTAGGTLNTLNVVQKTSSASLQYQDLTRVFALDVTTSKTIAIADKFLDITSDTVLGTSVAPTIPEAFFRNNVTTEITY